jgi:hypothetical protein
MSHSYGTCVLENKILWDSVIIIFGALSVSLNLKKRQGSNFTIKIAYIKKYNRRIDELGRGAGGHVMTR